MFGIKTEISLPLSREEGGAVRRSGGYTDHIIEADFVIQKFIQNAGAVCTFHAATFDYKSYFAHCYCLFLLKSVTVIGNR